MISTFIDKATGLLNRQYILSYWFPVFISFAFVLILNIYFIGLNSTQIWWENLQCFIMNDNSCNNNIHIDFIIYSIAGVTFISYVIQIFSNQIVRFFEGYWSLSVLKKLSIKMTGKKREMLQKLNNDRDTAIRNGDNNFINEIQRKLYLEYPSDDNLLLPTKIGNVLRSAEMYSNECYGMDGVFWWPRLWPLLPEQMKRDIDDAITPMLALLNFTFLLPAFTFLSIIYSISVKKDIASLFPEFIPFIIMIVISLILAWIAYRAAVSQAINYGLNIRAAVDLYRLDLLKSLNQTIPTNLNEESIMWNNLLKWLYTKDRTFAPEYRNI